MVFIQLYNNSCSSYTYHKITTMWYIFNLLSCNTPIDDIDYQAPYLDMFVWRSCSMPKELSNTSTQSLLIFSRDTYGIMIGRSPNFFLVTWFHYNISCVIIQCIIRTFTVTIERRCISTCSLNYDVHVITCLHEFGRSC